MGTHPPSRRERRREGIPSRQRREAEASRKRRRSRLAWSGGGLVLAVLIIALVWHSLTDSASAGPVIDGVQCNTNEQLAYHIHQHLTLYDAGQPVTVPQGIGIDQKDNCLYWMHTHDTSGVIHVESPTRTQYTLGNFLDIWGQRITKTYFLTHGLAVGHSIRAYLATKPYAADPRDVPLTSRQVITVEYGPPWVAPDLSYAFTAGE